MRKIRFKPRNAAVAREVAEQLSLSDRVSIVTVQKGKKVEERTVIEVSDTEAVWLKMAGVARGIEPIGKWPTIA